MDLQTAPRTRRRSRRRARLSLVAATSLVVAGAGVLTASPASAGPNCPNGNHCVFLAGIGSDQHNYFNSDTNFTNDYFNSTGHVVNDFVWAASNSSTGGYASWYWYNINYGGGAVFCVKPGHSVNADQLSDDGVDGNGIGQRDEASSLSLRTSTAGCF